MPGWMVSKRYLFASTPPYRVGRDRTSLLSLLYSLKNSQFTKVETTSLGTDTVILASQKYDVNGSDGKCIKFSNAIRRNLKSPDYSTFIDAFKVK